MLAIHSLLSQGNRIIAINNKLRDTLWVSWIMKLCPAHFVLLYFIYSWPVWVGAANCQAKGLYMSFKNKHSRSTYHQVIEPVLWKLTSSVVCSEPVSSWSVNVLIICFLQHSVPCSLTLHCALHIEMLPPTFRLPASQSSFFSLMHVRWKEASAAGKSKSEFESHLANTHLYAQHWHHALFSTPHLVYRI